MKNKLEGGAAIDVVILASILIFIILPIFSLSIEKFIIQSRAQEIKDALDMSAQATYYALNTEHLSETSVKIDQERARTIFCSILSQNLKLDSNLMPLKDSVAQAQVVVKSLHIFSENFPIRCEIGGELTRTSVHCVVIIPVKPSIYRKAILGFMGKEYIEMQVHIDSEIPVDR